MLPDISLTRIDGVSESFRDYEGKCLLIVNVASRCGFTLQYEQFQSLHKELKNKKFEILAFPCNQFGSQEPASNEEIIKFCESKYDVTFPIFEKTEVNGNNTHPLYDFLKSEAPGLLGSGAIKWNFTKFLLNSKGEVIKRFAPQTTINEIRKDLMPLLVE
jgi:glutathione peroxidase